jgi:hypothetical protein
VPTLLHVEGYRFFFFSNEGNEPPHVHVEHGDGTAKFWLDPIGLAYSMNIGARLLRRARELVTEHAGDFRRRWQEHFGA